MTLEDQIVHSLFHNLDGIEGGQRGGLDCPKRKLLARTVRVYPARKCHDGAQRFRSRQLFISRLLQVVLHEQLVVYARRISSLRRRRY